MTECQRNNETDATTTKQLPKFPPWKALPSAVDTRVQLATGYHAKAIVKEGEAVHADLVVVGRSGRFRPLGSTALRVLRDNKRALLVVPIVDCAAFKDVKMGARATARVNVFGTNLFSHPNWGRPETNLTSANYGRITSLSPIFPLRTIVVGGRITY